LTISLQLKQVGSTKFGLTLNFEFLGDYSASPLAQGSPFSDGRH
jgi:hypothetical protein